MMLADDRDLIVEFLSRQWLPPDVKLAYDRLRDAERCDLQETGLGVSIVATPSGRLLRAGATCQ